MADPLASCNLPPWSGTPTEAAEVWELAKNRNVARCSLWTHPTRTGEVRVTINGEMHRSEALNDARQLLDLALQWRDGFKERGWS